MAYDPLSKFCAVWLAMVSPRWAMRGEAWVVFSDKFGEDGDLAAILDRIVTACESGIDAFKDDPESQYELLALVSLIADESEVVDEELWQAAAAARAEWSKRLAKPTTRKAV